MPKKLQPIKYTSRDFDSIRRDLENYAKRYYPNTYKDFNEASFGALMLDTVAYMGDILSFYLDYQTNESFLDSAIEYNNVIRLARQMGFKLSSSPSSYGSLTFYIEVPATTSGGGSPDIDYAPVLKAGSQFASAGGGSYTLLEDVDFSKSSNLVVAGEVNSSTGQARTYIIRAPGRIVSGRVNVETKTVGEFQRFLQIPLATNTVAEILSVTDSEGHLYYEVDNLSQNIIYKAIQNNNNDRSLTPSILKAVPVARRFVLEYTGEAVYLQFGYGSDSELLSESVINPSDVIMDLYGRDYITDREFDPTKLISTDKFGIAPANTTLTIAYRINTTRDVNAAVDTITDIGTTNFKFSGAGSLDAETRGTVRNSLELTNELPVVGDISLPSSEEIRQRVISYFAAQHRAVTLEDYQAMIYSMPAKFGSIKRCAVTRDFSEFKRNLNIHIISEDPETDKLIVSNATLRNNLKTWLAQYKMINDTIDVFNARIINFGVEYIIVTDYETNRYTALNKATSALKDLFNDPKDIGEPIYITDIYRKLQEVPGIVDVMSVEIVEKSGGVHSPMAYNFYDAMSADGRQISADGDVIFELKYPDIDIKGSVR